MAAAHSTVCDSTCNPNLSGFARHLYTQLGLGDVTVRNYLSCIRRLEPLLSLQPTAEACEDHLAAMRRRGASYSHQVNTAIALERYMSFLGTPVTLKRPKKPRRLVRGTLSEAEVTLWINAAKNLREKAILSLLAFSGLRNKELCRLTIEDVDIANQRITVRDGKGHKDRDAAIAPSCVTVLLEYLRERNGQPHEPLFVTVRHHTSYHPQDLRKLVRQSAARAGLHKRVFPYLLRHSLATNLLHRGAHLLAIKDQLGHAYVETTMIYLHSDPARMQMQYRMFAPSYL